MDGIVLDRSEFLVLLDAARATAVVGFRSEELFPAKAEEHHALLDEGVAKLQKRGLLDVRDDGVRAIDELLLQVIAVVVQPQIALITTRDTPGIGSQLFLHYQHGPYVVEQTLPEPGQHRLATIPSILALFDRVLDIFPIAEQEPADSISFSLPQDVFLQVKELAEQSQNTQASQIVARHGVNAESASILLDTLARPKFGGTVALLRCEDQKIIDGRNPAIVQGEQAALVIVPVATDPPKMNINQIHAAALKEQFASWFQELMPELFNT
jgi:hypothetical protein